MNCAMFCAFQSSLPGSAGWISNHVLVTVFPSSVIAVTGESSTRSICDSGTSEGVETTSRGAAEAAMVMARVAVKAEVSVFMNE